MDDDARDEAAFGIDRNRSDRVPGAGSRRDEVQRLTGQRAANRIDRVSAKSRGLERQSNDRARLGARGGDRELWGLSSDTSRDESTKCNGCINAVFHE